MADQFFDADDFEIDPDSISDSFIDGGFGEGDPQEEARKRARLILERYIRDYEKNVQKGIINLTNTATVFDRKQTVRGGSNEAIDELIEQMASKQVQNVTRMGIEMDKQFDHILTRLKTQGGISEDFDAISKAREEYASIFEEAEGIVEASASDLADRSKQALEDRENSKKETEGIREAQRKGREAQRKFLEENMDLVNPTMSDSVQLAMSAAFGLGDGQAGLRERRNETFRKAREQGEEVFKKELERRQIESEKNFQGGKVPEGMDIKDLALAGVRAGAIIQAVRIADQVVGRVQDQYLGAMNSFSQGKSTTGSIMRTVGSNMSFGFEAAFPNVIGKILATLDEIAMNTSRQVEAFSPELINANINRQLILLDENMRRADELGPQLAKFNEGQTLLETELKKVSDSFLQAGLPALQSIQQFLTLMAANYNEKGGFWGGLKGTMDDLLMEHLDPDNWVTAYERAQARLGQSSGHIQEIEAFFKNESTATKQNTNLPKNIR
jgi:hypothetical protein